MINSLTDIDIFRYTTPYMGLFSTNSGLKISDFCTLLPKMLEKMGGKRNRLLVENEEQGRGGSPKG